MSGTRRALDAVGTVTARARRGVQRLAARIDLANTAETLRTTQTRERWLEVGQEVTTAMLEGADVEDALTLIAARLREVADADAACLVLPGLDDEWVIEIADGDPGDLVGLVMPPGGRAHQVLARRKGMVVPSLARTPSLRVPQFARYGPALYAPMVAGGAGTGVIVLLRAAGAPEFRPAELVIAESFARQAALALELAAARRASDRAALLDERARIARDLHDLAIQQLFATGLTVARVRDEVTGRPADDLEGVLAGLDEAVAQIRGIVASLRREGDDTPLTERLEHERALARIGLGYLPERSTADDAALDAWAATAEHELVDDVVAVVREGLANAARHARAGAVAVVVATTPDGVRVEVRDDGAGIAPDRTRSSGLDNLAARAARWHGSLDVRPGPDGGTVLTWGAHG